MSYRATVVPLTEVPQESPLEALKKDAPPGTGPLILVVDDDRLVADTLTLVFRHAGFRVMTAYDPRVALAMAAEHLPSIVVSDVDMPGMDGVAMAMEIRRKCPTCPVVLVSGHATLESLIAQHGDSFHIPLLTKPVHPTHMLAAVHSALENVRFGLPVVNATVVAAAAA